jgi:TonB family protein
MFEPNTIEPKTDRPLLVAAPRRRFDNKQNRLMVGALALLLVALGLILYNDRDFWFPEAQEADGALDQPEQVQPAVTAPPMVTPKASATVRKPLVATNVKPTAPTAAKPATAKPVIAKKERHSQASAQTQQSAPVVAAVPLIDPPVAGPVATTTRTVLPPLEVEVVAGDSHQTVRPGTNSVRVDLQAGAPAQAAGDPFVTPETTAGVTNKAAEHVQLSAGTAAVVTRSVKPNYPLLARQMKVQGSVILQALIGRDGLIQGLHVLSGPPILANAAEEAVKQWHFKPHYQGSEAVETLAQITVNFTISTN